jgi:CRISPR/Cas system CMR-associated protein Cmr5 small subunit
MVTYHNQTGKLPPKLMSGLANYLALYSKAEKTEKGYFVTINNDTFKLNDEHVETVISAINQQESGLANLFANTTLWGTDLAAVPGFTEQLVQRLAKV